MSVRNGLLALLQDEPRHCYALKTGFETRTGDAWTINIGQVYSTLERLERDGLVTPATTDGDSNVQYRLTDAGVAELSDWYRQPVRIDPPPRDEFMIKVLLAVGSDMVDVPMLLQGQRRQLIAVLQRYTRQKELLDESQELETVLLHDALILRIEAELRWLDLCEARLGRRTTRNHAQGDHG